FSGGSRVIQENLLSPSVVLAGSLTVYFFSGVIGLYLVYRAGAGLLWFGVPGMLLSFFYTAPPLRLGYRGWGETVVGVLLGPLAVMGATFVFSKSINPESFLLSLTPGLLVTGILFINQFPDRDSDIRAGKRHWVTRLEAETSVRVYTLLISAAFLLPLVFVFLGHLPPGVLLCFLALPLAIRAILILRRHVKHPSELLPAQALTIKVHLLAGLGMMVGLLWNP
ncbi:MAG TPA: prenyltransferase, partial [Nitrospiria bacterium]|nr:prenyltransferase [Nitrospiria bacterium]